MDFEYKNNVFELIKSLYGAHGQIILRARVSNSREFLLSAQRDFQQHVVTQRKPEHEIVAPYFLVIAAIQSTKSFVP